MTRPTLPWLVGAGASARGGARGGGDGHGSRAAGTAAAAAAAASRPGIPPSSAVRSGSGSHVRTSRAEIAPRSPSAVSPPSSPGSAPGISGSASRRAFRRAGATGSRARRVDDSTDDDDDDDDHPTPSGVADGAHGAEPSPERMRPGDAAWVMVEDEFLAAAQSFTQHLYRAEYVRIRALGLPGGGGAQPSKLPHTVRAEDNVTPAARTHAAPSKKGAARAPESDAEPDDPWLGTRLADLMSSPHRAEKRRDLRLGRMGKSKAVDGEETLLNRGQQQQQQPRRDAERAVDSDDDDLDTGTARGPPRQTGHLVHPPAGREVSPSPAHDSLPQRRPSPKSSPPSPSPPRPSGPKSPDTKAATLPRSQSSARASAEPSMFPDFAPRPRPSRPGGSILARRRAELAARAVERDEAQPAKVKTEGQGDGESTNGARSTFEVPTFLF